MHAEKRLLRATLHVSPRPEGGRERLALHGGLRAAPLVPWHWGQRVSRTRGAGLQRRKQDAKALSHLPTPISRDLRLPDREEEPLWWEPF